MGYCGIKITGHSETDFKHKKVFAKSQKMLSHKPIFTDVRIEQREQAPSYLWFKRMKIIIVFTFIATILLLTTAFSSKMNNLYVDKKAIKPKSI